jgi:hypothetical protein
MFGLAQDLSPPGLPIKFTESYLAVLAVCKHAEGEATLNCSSFLATLHLHGGPHTHTHTHTHRQREREREREREVSTFMANVVVNLYDCRSGRNNTRYCSGLACRSPLLMLN